MITGKYIIKIDGEVVAEKSNLITTNGFLMINRFLAKSSTDWAGSIVVGAMTNSPAITDKTLYYELARSPITLKSYARFNPRYIITNKQLTTNVATLTFQSPTTPQFATGYTIQVSGVDSTFNGIYSVTALNTTVQPTTTTLGTFTITYSKTASNVSSTAVSSSTALITASLDTTGAIVYNNEIVVKSTLPYDREIKISEIGVVPLGTVSGSSKDNVVLTDFSEVSTTDSSISKWTSSGTVNVVGLTYIQGSGASPTGYSWANSSAVASFYVTSTRGMKVGSLVYLSGVTPAIASTIALTSATGSGTAMTYNSTLNHNLISGQSVTITGFSTTGYNVTGTVTVTGLKAFTIAGATTGGTGGGSAAVNTWSMSGTVSQINGNSQVLVTMPYTNTYSSSQSGYAGTLSVNSSSVMQPSYSGMFNVKLSAGSSAAITLSSLTFNAYAYNASDKLCLLYYASAAITSKTFTLTLTDSNGTTYPLTSSVTVASAGWYMACFSLTSFPASGASITTVKLETSTSTADIYPDSLNFVSGSYWSAHPTSGSTNVYLPPEYQLTSRSIFSTPIVKSAGQQMDIEYHIQVT